MKTWHIITLLAAGGIVIFVIYQLKKASPVSASGLAATLLNLNPSFGATPQATPSDIINGIIEQNAGTVNTIIESPTTLYPQ